MHFHFHLWQCVNHKGYTFFIKHFNFYIFAHIKLLMLPVHIIKAISLSLRMNKLLTYSQATFMLQSIKNTVVTHLT